MQATAQAARRRRHDEAAGQQLLFEADHAVVAKPAGPYRHIGPWEPPDRRRGCDVVLDIEPAEPEDPDPADWMDAAADET